MKVKDENREIVKREHKKSTFKLEFKCGHQIVKMTV